MKEFPTIEFKTSFGSKDSKLDPWPTKDGDNTICRFAIGYESNHDELVSEFDSMLKMIK